jgi:hypothetical protein
MIRQINNRAIVFALCIIVVAWESVGPANAGTLSGRLRYTRDWAGCSTAGTSRAPCIDNGTPMVMEGMIISFRNTSTQAVTASQTNATGNYSATLAAGTYQLRLHYRDGSLTGSGGAFGNASVGLVTDASNPVTELLDTVGTSPNVPASGTATYNLDLGVTPATPHERANAYAAAKLAARVWTQDYASAWINPGLYRARIQHVTNTAAAGAFCATPMYDCVINARVNFSLRNVDVLWHELGHGIQQFVQLSSYDNLWRSGSASCSDSGDSASGALMEGWADFVGTLTKYSPADIPQFVHGAICGACEYPATGIQPNPPACGTGRITRNRYRVEKALLELVDTSQGTETGCRIESVQMPVSILVDALQHFGGNGSCRTLPGCISMCNLGEGGFAESWSCPSNPSTPNWPYTGTNALARVDQMSLLDYLAVLRDRFGLSGDSARTVWANSCWHPGDTAIAF